MRRASDCLSERTMCRLRGGPDRVYPAGCDFQSRTPPTEFFTMRGSSRSSRKSARNSSRERVKANSSTESPCPGPPPAFPWPPPSGRGSFSPGMNLRLPGSTYSRSPPDACRNPGSPRSLTGTETPSPRSRSFSDLLNTASSTARRTCSL